MDCTDIVWAAVHKGRVVIRDAYSRDMSTPLDDDWFGGKDSITDIRGWQLEDFEAGLRTIVLFRRKVKASEPSDHPLGPGPMFGIYAKGSASKSEDESTELVENKERIFFQPDEINLKGENRGVAEYVFVSKEEFEKISDGSSKICCYNFGFIIFLMCLQDFVSKMTSWL